MRAAVYHGTRDVRVEDVPAPGAPGQGELLLEVARCGICGTDVAEFLAGPHLIPQRPHPATGRALPLTIGHEFTGRVLAAGPGAAGFRAGDRVASSAVVTCGECRPCRRGRPNLCERYHALGLQGDGGLAEQVLVPARSCVPVAPGCSDDNAALAQPLAIALHAFRQTPRRPDGAMLLLGAGGIGALYLAVAKSRGCRVLVADPDPVALERARALGADATLDLRSEPLAQGLVRWAGEDSVATIVECSGRAESLAAAAPLVEPGGALVLVGHQRGAVALDLLSLTVREVTVATSQALVNEVDLPAAAELLAGQDLAPLLVDRVIPLEGVVPDGLLAFARGEVHGKVLIDPGRPHGEPPAGRGEWRA